MTDPRVTRIPAPESVPTHTMVLIDYECKRYPDYKGSVDIVDVFDGRKGTLFDDSDYTVTVCYSLRGYRAVFGVTDGKPDLWMD